MKHCGNYFEIDNFLRPDLSKRSAVEKPWNFLQASLAFVGLVLGGWGFLWLWFFVTGK